MRHCRTPNGGIKQYSTIEILCKYQDDDGLALSLAGMTIKSDMQTSNGRHVDSLDIVILDEVGGVFMMTPTISKLPADTLKIDIIFEKDGKIVTSDTFTIDVDVAITNPFLGA